LRRGIPGSEEALGSTSPFWALARRFDPRWALHRVRGRSAGRRNSGEVVEYWDARYEETTDLFELEGTSHERRRYQFLLAALADGPLGRTLELGCSVGVLTRMLAERTDALVATDISEVVLDAAQKRLAEAGHDRIEFRQADLPDGVPEGPFGTIIASELLYYLRADEVSEAGRRLASALAPGGRLLTAHTRGYFPRHAISADHAARLVGRTDGLRSVGRWGGSELRVDVFERAPS
jgi:SAM-dependent methyltransferase